MKFINLITSLLRGSYSRVFSVNDLRDGTYKVIISGKFHCMILVEEGSIYVCINNCVYVCRELKTYKRNTEIKYSLIKPSELKACLDFNIPQSSVIEGFVKNYILKGIVLESPLRHCEKYTI